MFSINGNKKEYMIKCSGLISLNTINRKKKKHCKKDDTVCLIMF